MENDREIKNSSENFFPRFLRGDWRRQIAKMKCDTERTMKLE